MLRSATNNKKFSSRLQLRSVEQGVEYHFHRFRHSGDDTNVVTYFITSRFTDSTGFTVTRSYKHDRKNPGFRERHKK